MHFFGSASSREGFESAALTAAIRAIKICHDSGVPFDAEEHKRWCEERVCEPVVLKVGEPETRGAYLNKHRTFLISEERNNISVRRRYSDFEWLHAVMRARYVGMLLPSLPEKNLLQSEAFVQSRIRGLSLFLQQVMASPYLRSDPAVALFFTKTDEKEWEAAKADKAALEKNGGVGLKRWIKRIAAQRIPFSAEHDLAAFKHQVEQQERVVSELVVCANRLAEKSLAMSRDVSSLHQLLNGWSVAETTTSDQNAELLMALGTTTSVVSQWMQVVAHEPTIYEVILHESLKYLSYQIRDMKELLVRRETVAMQAIQSQHSGGRASSSSVVSNLTARFRSNSDSVVAHQGDQPLLRMKQAADLVTRALLAEEIDRFRRQVVTDTINHFACAHGHLSKKAAIIWRDHVKNHVSDKESLLTSTKQIVSLKVAATEAGSAPAFFA